MILKSGKPQGPFFLDAPVVPPPPPAVGCVWFNGQFLVFIWFLEGELPPAK